MFFSRPFPLSVCVDFSLPSSANTTSLYVGGITHPQSSKFLLRFSCCHQLSDTPERAQTLSEMCSGRVPECTLKRAAEIGYVMPTDIQRQSLPILFSGMDCILHAQTGSGKTLVYLLLIFSVIEVKRSTVQALIVVPTRELGMQVAKVARILAAEPSGYNLDQKACTVMALLDGGALRRHKRWLKADPPKVIVATVGCLYRFLEQRILKLSQLRVLVIDEVDFMFNLSKQGQSLRKLLMNYITFSNRQTIFASASIPQHNHFIRSCIQEKWTKSNVVHVHVNSVKPIPLCILHRFVVCSKNERMQTLLRLLCTDAPNSAIVFLNEQSEKSKWAGEPPPTPAIVEFLKASYHGQLEICLVEEEMNFHARAASISHLEEDHISLNVLLRKKWK